MASSLNLARTSEQIIFLVLVALRAAFPHLLQRASLAFCRSGFFLSQGLLVSPDASQNIVAEATSYTFLPFFVNHSFAFLLFFYLSYLAPHHFCVNLPRSPMSFDIFNR